MLFTSPAFLFAFLPAVLTGTFLLARLEEGWGTGGWGAGARWAAPAMLAAASLGFYAWERPHRLLPIIGGSIAFNYLMGRLLARHRHLPLLWLGVGGNLAALFWFKYAGFVASSAVVFGLPVPVPHVVLPIGISFFTFTQIGFLVDTFRREAQEPSARDYVLFVTFFPHLIAGPILHHREMMPQFARPGSFRPHWPSIALGLSWFSAGLCKKVLLADGIAPHADAVFQAASQGAVLSTAGAWLGAISYTLQLYFDFSGYSDMAVGLALLFGITFPLNFFSPYKASSLIEFWRRWHITLSRLLRDYLYIPLGGNRRGPGRRLLNLFLTMLLGGLWHGAAWTFVAWGALHGAGLVTNHLWRGTGWRLPSPLGQAITLTFVVLAWVPFRAETLAAASGLWQSMFVPQGGAAAPPGTLPWVLALSAAALLLPNTAQVFGWARAFAPAGSAGPWQWRATIGSALGLGAALGVAVAGAIAQPATFLYFRF